MSYIEYLNAHRTTTVRLKAFGWAPGLSGFALGDTMYRADGNHTSSQPGKLLMPYLPGLARAGSPQPWLDAAKLYGQPGMEGYAFALLAAFGAPLMKLLGCGGVILSLRGGPGTGKTTVQRMIASVYGDPHSVQGLLMTRDSAESARVQRLTVMQSLPVCLDDLTNIPADELAGLCYTVSQGIGRAAVNKTGREEIAAGTWNTIMVTSSAASLYDRLSRQKADASAEALRVFEYALEPGSVSPTLVADAMRALGDNHGWVGHSYIERIVSAPDELSQLLHDHLARIEHAGGFEPKEKLWATLITAATVGGRIARTLGIIDYDIAALERWALRQVEHMRGAVNDNTLSAEEVVKLYLQENKSGVSELTNDSRGRRAEQVDSLMVIKKPTTEPCILRFVEYGVTFIDRQNFRTWCHARSIEYQRVRDGLVEKKILIDSNQRRRLVPYISDTPQVACLQLDENKLNGKPSNLRFFPTRPPTTRRVVKRKIGKKED